MACLTCKDDCKWNIVMPCRVCELNSNDSTPKAVCWCDDCSAYICKLHWNDIIARGIAAVRSFFAPKSSAPAPAKDSATSKEVEKVNETVQEMSADIDTTMKEESKIESTPEEEDKPAEKTGRKRIFGK